MAGRGVFNTYTSNFSQKGKEREEKREDVRPVQAWTYIVGASVFSGRAMVLAGASTGSVTAGSQANFDRPSRFKVSSVPVDHFAQSIDGGGRRIPDFPSSNHAHAVARAPARPACRSIGCQTVAAEKPNLGLHASQQRGIRQADLLGSSERAGLHRRIAELEAQLEQPGGGAAHTCATAISRTSCAGAGGAAATPWMNTTTSVAWEPQISALVDGAPSIAPIRPPFAPDGGVVAAQAAAVGMVVAAAQSGSDERWSISPISPTSRHASQASPNEIGPPLLPPSRSTSRPDSRANILLPSGADGGADTAGHVGEAAGSDGRAAAAGVGPDGTGGSEARWSGEAGWGGGGGVVASIHLTEPPADFHEIFPAKFEHGPPAPAAGIGGAFSSASVSAMREQLRAKVHVASRWLAELASVASASEPVNATPSELATSYLSVRYLSAMCSLLVSLCQLPPRLEHLPLFDELAIFVSNVTDASGGIGPAGGAMPPAPLGAGAKLAVGGKTALLASLNELCALLAPHSASPVELHSALKRAILSIHAEVSPLLEQPLGPSSSLMPPTPLVSRPSTPAGQPAGSAGHAGLRTPHLRMRSMVGGGGGADIGHRGGSASGHVEYTKAVHHVYAVPSRHPHHRQPGWVARSESLPMLPESGRGRASRAARTVLTARHGVR